MIVRPLGAAVALTAVLLATAGVRAQDAPAALDAPPPDGSLPARVVGRPLTLPAHTVRIDATLGYHHDERFALRIPGDSIEVDPEGTIFALLGARFALHDDVELSALLVPARIAPDAHYGFPSLSRDLDTRDPWLAATWRFLSARDTDLGVRARAYVPQHRETRGRPRFDLEALAAIRTPAFRLEPSLLIALRANAGRTLELAAIPFSLTYQPADPVWLVLRTGLYAHADLTELVIPGALAAGTTVTHRGQPIADFWLEGEAPHLLRPTANDPTDVDVLTLTVNAAVFLR